MPRILDAMLRLATVLYLFLQSVLVGLAAVPAALLVLWVWRATGSYPLAGLALGPAYLVFGLSFLALIVLVKHATFFRARVGDYPFVSLYAIRWAFVGSLVGLAKILILRHLLGFPLLNLFYRLMGARIGRGVLLNTCNLFDFELVEIGDGAFLGGDAVVLAHAGEGGLLRLRRVRIGRGCTVGQSAVLLPGSTMEDGAVLGALSLLPKGRTLPAGSVWGGNPIEMLRAAPGASAAPGEGEAPPSGATANE